MKILLVSELFFPTNRIGALRPSKICKYLVGKGYDVDVITAYPADGLFDPEHCHIYSISDSAPCDTIKNESAQHAKLKGEFWDQLRYFKRTLKSYRSEKKYAKKAIALFENGILNVNDYDACFTTFGPLSSILIGIKLKSRYHIKNWICDFRDPVAVKMCSAFMFPLYKYLQNKACRNADKVVAVSNGYVRRICGHKYSKKAFMIPNGYDLSDKVCDSDNQANDKLTLTYVGTLYDGKRDITPIFRALADLDRNGEVSIANVRFSYAGPDFSSLLAQAEKYRLQNILEDNGRLPRSACLQKQHESDILVLSTWNEKGEEGVFPGKFLEYMLIGKPIISLTCGKMPNGEVTSVMREGNLGLAYEEATDDADYIKLKQYLKMCYSEWLNTRKIAYEPLRSVLDRYNYDLIMEKMEELLCGG